MRRGVLVAGIIVLAVGVVLAVLPRDDSFHAVVADRFAANAGDWVFSGPFFVRPGMELSVSWTSSWSVTFGITDSLLAFQYVTSRIAPTLVVSDSGTSGHVDITFSQEGSYVFAALTGPGSGLLNLTADVRSHEPFAYLAWGVLLSCGGALMMIVGSILSEHPRRRGPSESYLAEAAGTQRFCPSCGAQYDSSLGRFCPRDDTELKSLPDR